MTRRRCTAEEPRAILRDADLEGVSVAARKHSITPSLIYKWRERTDNSIPGMSAEEAAELRSLRHEVRQLKEIVAEKEIEMRIKDMLLKKTEARRKIS